MVMITRLSSMVMVMVMVVVTMMMLVVVVVIMMRKRMAMRIRMIIMMTIRMMRIMIIIIAWSMCFAFVVAQVSDAFGVLVAPLAMGSCFCFPLFAMSFFAQLLLRFTLLPRSYDYMCRAPWDLELARKGSVSTLRMVDIITMVSR